MKKEDFLNALRNLRKSSKKRKFEQTVDLVINLKEVDKKFNLDTYVKLPYDTGKGVRICAIVDTLAKEAQDAVDKVIRKEELMRLEPKEIAKISGRYDIFIAEAGLMGQIAGMLGKVLGPLGKMPNPKVGGVIMPGQSIKAAVSKFRSNLKLKNKNEAIIKASLGKENFEDEKLTENAYAIYEAVVHALPYGDKNIKDAILKFTMSNPIKIGQKIEAEKGKE